MRLKRSRTLAVSGTAVLALLAAGVPGASAQTLFDLLFNNERRVQRQAPIMVEPTPVQPVTPPRVTGPSYYTYKTDPLVRVDFAAIQPVRQDDGAALVSPGIDERSVASTTVGAGETATLVAELADEEETASDAVTEAAIEEDGETSASTSEPPEVESAVRAVEAVAEEETFADPEPVVASAQPLTDDQIAALQEFTLLAEKETAEALVAHYSVAPEMMWLTDGRPNDKARGALRVLGEARSHGLDSRDYAVSVPSGSDDATLARFEMELSARLLRYARDARSGRIDPNRISGYHDFKPKELDLVALLNSVRESNDVAALMEAQHPQNAHYRALRVELEMLRTSAENEIVVAPNTLIRPGERNGEFPKLLTLIKQRADTDFLSTHGEVLDRHAGSEAYVQELVPVIKAAQLAAGVGDDGVIGPRTVQALAGESRAGRIEKVEVALEQLRWLPSDLTDRHVFINTPAFEANYVENGEEKLSMRTVVGTVGTQTYFFQDEISYVEFHPYWGVPRSILVNKYLPKLYSDPGYLDRSGFEVTDRRGQRIPSASINWGQYGANIPYDVRQRPGSSNALGEMKIMFPNSHAIYMHDTPDRHLFSRENRALSNGCIRLADPRAMAAAVLGWSREQVDARVAGQHGREDLSVKVPVYVAYFTAWPDKTGEVHYFTDVYSRDEKTRAALNRVEAVRATGA